MAYKGYLFLPCAEKQMLIKTHRGRRQMGKKLARFGPNISKHLQKNYLTRKDGFTLSPVFLLLRESPCSELDFRSFTTICSCLNPGERERKKRTWILPQMASLQTHPSTGEAIKLPSAVRNIGNVIEKGRGTNINVKVHLQKCVFRQPGQEEPRTVKKKKT